MARSRRSKNRSISQRAVSLLAAGLPAPVQRIAESSIGSKLLLWGIPALLVAGVLQLDWEGGLPHLSLDRQRAAEIREAAREELVKINPTKVHEWENSAKNLWNASQTANQNPNYQSPSANKPNPQSNNHYPNQQTDQQPNYQQPSYQQPTYQQPYAQPAYSQQTHPQPTYQQPSYPQPTYQQPQAYQPLQQTQSPNYQPQQYQSYQPPFQGQWRQ
ncbi:MAG: hypothetical protein NTW52_06595 [Planctomycetota bacterium]|nr:hypothetical protein [Planctomycetota bacterium]